MRSGHVTAHNLETGETKTFAPGDDLPDWAEKFIKEGNPDALQDAEEKDQAPVPGPSQGEDLIGNPSGGDDDPLMKRSKDDLVTGAEQWSAQGVSDSNTKAELAAAIRTAGYEGDGSDLLDGE